MAIIWERIKETARKVGRYLGIINHLERLEDHKKINVDQDEYSRIEFNKQLYAGNQGWRNLNYHSSTGRQINRKQKSLGMGKVIASKLASLVFNEGVDISLAEDAKHTETWEKISDAITSAKFKREFQRYLEYMFAMGGVAVETYLDGDEPKLAYATADAFFPISQDTENVDEAVIANQFKKDGFVYTLLKWHEWETDDVYRITNELYKSKTSEVLGDQVGLHELFPDMEPETRLRVARPTFVYIKPNTANNKNLISPLGVSVYENVHDTLEMLDVMYDFWYNEFRLGKRRVAVPQYLVKHKFDINGNMYTYIDDSEELFVALNSGEIDEMQVKDLTIDLRTEDVIHSIQSMLDVLSMQIGLSAGTFTFTEGGIKTATQVVSEQSETFRTRGSHLSIIEDALRDLIVSLSEVATLNGGEPLGREEISIDFNDGVFQDKEAQAQYYTRLYQSGLIPAKEVIMRLFGKSEEEAEEWLDAINEEKATASKQFEESIASLKLNGREEGIPVDDKSSARKNSTADNPKNDPELEAKKRPERR